MAGGKHKYTVVESQNTGLGQVGSVFCDSTDNITPSSGVFVAITVIDDVTFTTLTPEDGAGEKFIGTGTASTSGSGTGNLFIDTGNTFTTGTTIFGRWSSITLNGGTIVAYIG